jgi:polyisoprenoid-binding protein YceI
MSTYNIDPSHSTASFSVKHMMIAKVHGGFEKLSGTFQYDSKDPEASRIEVTIDASSINTREAQRDAHLKSADFFDVEKYPHLTFISKKIVANGDALKVTGDLTIHGVTNEVVLDVEGPTGEVKDPWGNMKIAASGTAKIRRKDFGLTWNAALEAGGFLVGDDVSITFDVQLVKQA